MEILRKFVFYTLAVLAPIQLVIAIICMFTGKKTDEILRLLRLIVTVWILAGLYFGSMII